MIAVLKIDLPEDCSHCPFRSGKDQTGCYTCEAKGYNWLDHKCPLKVLPEKKEMTDTQMKSLDGLYVKAWNDCLDELENSSTGIICTNGWD